MATRAAGSARIQGEWWGRRARDWSSFQEATGVPLFAAALARLEVRLGTRVLDLGCGSGLFCEMAARRGAAVAGIDAAEPFVEIARRRLPEGRFEVGDIEALTFEDHSFDAVTAFNSIQYAASPAHAIGEAARVARPGASVLVATWADADDCEALAYLRALAAHLPPPPPGAPEPLALSDPKALSALAADGGLVPRQITDVDVPWVYPDLQTALSALLSAGPAARAIESSGEEQVRSAVAGAVAPYRLASGAYRLENRFRCLIAGA